MKSKISTLIITKNNEETIGKTLLSLKGLTSEIVVVDSNSNDRTANILKKYKAKVIVKEFDNIGRQRMYGMKYVTGDWVLILDSDEVVSEKLKKEIKKVSRQARKSNLVAYEIPFQNHFLGRPVKYGGENYKMLRLFRKKALEIRPLELHNYFVVKKGKTSKLKGEILHYSYRSIGQIYRKFTDYAKRDARIRAQKGEKSSLKKIFLYPIHMFWARFIEDKGYKDGLFRIPLDLGFAYMEFLTYIILATL